MSRLINKLLIKIFGLHRFMAKKGLIMGKNTRVLSDYSCFGTEPYLIEIGDNCLISSNVCFMTHDGGISVLNNLNYFDERMDKLGKIKIGNNCFIGKNVTIMPGVEIGDNCIIGLGSVVTKNIPNNSVACGIPAKVIKSIDEYRNGITNNIFPTANMSFNEKRNYCKKYFNR